MTFKILRISLILLLAFTQTTFTEESPEEAPEGDTPEGEAGEAGGDDSAEEEAAEEQPTCNEELLNSYGLLGMKFKEEMEMHICSNVKQSCCQLEDQLAIYDELTKGEELTLLNERLEYHKKVTANSTLTAGLRRRYHSARKSARHRCGDRGGHSRRGTNLQLQFTGAPNPVLSVPDHHSGCERGSDQNARIFQRVVQGSVLLDLRCPKSVPDRRGKKNSHIE